MKFFRHCLILLSSMLVSLIGFIGVTSADDHKGFKNEI